MKLALTPARFPYRKFLLALLVSAVGGGIFYWAHLPLPWVLGPLTGCSIAAVLSVPLAAPPAIRAPMTSIIGVTMGTTFSPDIIAQMPGWGASILGLFVYLMISASICIAYFRYVARFDLRTAYFAGMPGGIVEMITLSDLYGGNIRKVSLVQAARILTMVFTLPFLVSLISGADISARGRTGSSITELPPSAYLWVIGTALLGLLLGRIARLPAKWLMGPMLVSAAVHAFGLTEFRPPSEMVKLAQLIIGMTLGCRFAGVPAREILHTLMISVGSVVLLLGTALISAYLVSRITDESVISLILAYSPGGLAEMSLVALALHAEVAFVVAHHLVRVFAVLTLAQPIFRLLQHLSRNDRQH